MPTRPRTVFGARDVSKRLKETRVNPSSKSATPHAGYAMLLTSASAENLAFRGLSGTREVFRTSEITKAPALAVPRRGGRWGLHVRFSYV
jgi:hypothetical protein